MAKSVTGERLTIKEGRLAFLHCFEPNSVDGGKESFNCNIILEPGNEAVAMIRAEEERLAKLAWGDKAGAVLEMIKAKNDQALKPGALKAKFDGFAGNLFLSAKNAVRPTVVNRNGSPLTAKDGVIYSGAYALIHISLWTQDNNFGQKINANLLGLQFLRDGDAFSGGPAPSAADDFANLDAGEDEVDSIMG